jgi:excisionase family DNA binding protein
MLALPDMVTTAQLAEVMGCSRITAWRVAKQNRGFSVKFGGRYTIPRSNVERVLAGETPEQIAASILIKVPKITEAA